MRRFGTAYNGSALRWMPAWYISLGFGTGGGSGSASCQAAASADVPGGAIAARHTWLLLHTSWFQSSRRPPASRLARSSTTAAGP